MAKIYLIIETNKWYGELLLKAYSTEEAAQDAILSLEDDCFASGISSTFEYHEIELIE